MSAADDAYRAAQALIAEAKEEDATFLSLDTPETKALAILPPEIADLTSLRALSLDSTQIADLDPLWKLTGLSELFLDDTLVTDISQLAGLTGLKRLYLAGTSVSDLSVLRKLPSLRTLNLDGTPVSDLSPLAALAGLETLSLANTSLTDLSLLVALSSLHELHLGMTPIMDLTPLAALTELRRLAVDNTPVADLRPLRRLTRLVEDPFPSGLTFQNTEATRLDPRIAAISENWVAATRARELFAYLETWVPPGEVTAPNVPDRVPAPLETEIRDDVLAVAVPADPPLPPGPVDARARIGWQELRNFRMDFEGALNIANYRPLASAIGAFDRGMGDSYDTMNEVAVGVAGQRLAALASDGDFVATLPDGAGTELGTLAAAITTFTNRFPQWLAYLSDPEQAVPIAASVHESLPDFEAIARSLEQAKDVEPAVLAEYRDEVELVRTSPESELAARALLASTRDLLRTLSENVLIGFRLYLDNTKQKVGGAASATVRLVGNEAKEFAKLAPGETRKAAFWGVIGITSDILVLKGGMMMSLATRFPETFGWLATVLRYFGVVP